MRCFVAKKADSKQALMSKYYLYKSMIALTTKNVKRCIGNAKEQQVAQLERLKKEWMEVYVQLNGF